MTQSVAIITSTGVIQLELPSPDAFLLDGIRWGAVDAFPTPAYWQFQVIARRLVGSPARYKLGRTLAEEATACLLGGYGMPASVGIAAYQKLRERGAFCGSPPSERQIETWLNEPLDVGSRRVQYRFAKQKARYLAATLPTIGSAPTFNAGKELRRWLMQFPGIGPKTASWITRNWMDADDVAILDIHVMRIGQAIGLFPRRLTVERHYYELESLFLQFSNALGVRTSELDAVVWFELASSPAMSRIIVEKLRDATTRRPNRRQVKANDQVRVNFT